MESFQALLHMGGYGGYVWPAYGVGAVVLALVLILSLSAARKAEAELEVLQQARRARRGKDSETEE
ncbi:heme exporter protein CcmD [Magnetospirillum sp. ME-1]|uniref:heme exporter protein CcmD n=1 Tax=Magnetospirillum sp. ME-1 TaxID=1639348 RepID=UPI000A17BA4E|nr:heme exporter protein CcmD [Magnetospirillum sp. ME-1]ARJ68167.1 heme exporter protein CcmD [Magnetospirillum sp. ME-1]